MHTLLILATGLVIVVGGILAFRLHAFVVLILAGITVALLTPSALVTRSLQLEVIARRASIDGGARQILSAEPLKNWQSNVVALDRNDGVSLNLVGNVTAECPLADWNGELPAWSDSNTNQQTAKAICYRFEFLPDVDETLKAKVKQLSGGERLVVLSRKAFDSAKADGSSPFMKRLTASLGTYCGNLAILIVAASIIGRCLLDSGAADRIVRSTLQTVGEKNAPAAFVISGFTLSIPVFFDTVFYLMVPLAKALRIRTGANYLLYVMAIVAGGTMAHSLVPPTPGPLFIAEAFGVSIGSMIVGGTIVGLFSASVAMTYAVWMNRRFELALPEASDSGSPADVSPENDPSLSPPLWMALVPVMLPIVLITMGGLVKELNSPVAEQASTWTFAGISVPAAFAKVLIATSEKNLALLLSAIFAVWMYVRVKQPSRETFVQSMQSAVSSAGTIILVTAAGGAFGQMMRQTSVAELLQGLPGSSPIMVVVAAFLVTTAVRTSQGSATVAMLTAAGIFGGLVASGTAGVDPLYVALAVGCGSKPVSWMNDSGFWVITRMSGMTEQEGLKYVTPMTSLAGIAGLGAVILGVILFP
ncbi:MAG: GntP family permease [Fuerstiella sp.]